MNIKQIYPQSHSILLIIAEDGRMGYFDVTPYLKYEAFEMLCDPNEFIKVNHGEYFVEWDCGADLSADTIEAHWQLLEEYDDSQSIAEVMSALKKTGYNTDFLNDVQQGLKTSSVYAD
jgi:hypothetical protein